MARFQCLERWKEKGQTVKYKQRGPPLFAIKNKRNVAHRYETKMWAPLSMDPTAFYRPVKLFLFITYKLPEKSFLVPIQIIFFCFFWIEYKGAFLFFWIMYKGPYPIYMVIKIKPKIFFLFFSMLMKKFLGKVCGTHLYENKTSHLADPSFAWTENNFLLNSMWPRMYSQMYKTCVVGPKNCWRTSFFFLVEC